VSRSTVQGVGGQVLLSGLGSQPRHGGQPPGKATVDRPQQVRQRLGDPVNAREPPQDGPLVPGPGHRHAGQYLSISMRHLVYWSVGSSTRRMGNRLRLEDPVTVAGRAQLVGDIPVGAGFVG